MQTNEFARCPYCAKVVLGLDADGQVLRFDGKLFEPCPHVVLARGSFDRPEVSPRNSATAFFWAHPAKDRVVWDSTWDKDHFLTELVEGTLPGDCFPTVPFEQAAVEESVIDEAGVEYALVGEAIFTVEPAVFLKQAFARATLTGGDTWCQKLSDL